MKDNIDLVYTWVDGNDKKWLQKESEWRKKLLPDSVASSPCRFTDNNELMYSLRSVEKYAPWINHIYIVTDNQIPTWLNLDNPKISIVDHKEIIPNDALPTFNSVAIEHCIKNIPNLSEKFLYANDDMMFINYVKPEFFFNKKGVINRYIYIISYKDNTMFFSQLRNAAAIIERDFGENYYYHPHHNIDPYLKSDIEECYQKYKNDIDKTIYNKFRTYNDISRHIYACYTCAIGHGYWKQVHKVDRELNIFEYLYRIILKKYAKESLYLLLNNNSDFESTIKKVNPKLLCINDHPTTVDEDREKFKQFLAENFKGKSKFEK